MRVEQIEQCTLYLGNCMDILPTIRNVDAVVTDPPYGCKATTGRGGKFHKFSIKGDDNAYLRDEVVIFFKDTPMIMFGSQRMVRPSAPHTLLIWSKGEHTGMGDLKFPWKPDFEEIYIFGKGFKGPRTTSVLRFNADISSSRNHPTEKPIHLMEELVGKCDGAHIVDPFMGSGTTGVACVNLERKFTGVEIDQKYFDIACKRIERAYKTKPRLFNVLSKKNIQPMTQGVLF